MLIKKLAKSTALMLACCSLLGTSQSFADSQNIPEERVTTSYNTTITDGSTFETKTVGSGADLTATNEVKSKQSGTLKCWVESSGGSNVTNSVTYSGTGQKHMSYTSRPNSVKLNIQNVAGSTKAAPSISTSGNFHS
ncbi:MAG: hypothetical protein RR835_08605 [Peptostreptococcaceae bacterium]